MKIKKAIQLWKDFDFRVAFANFCASAFTHPRAVMLLRDEALVNYLRRNYKDVIQKYKNLPENNPPEVSNIIWSIGGRVKKMLRKLLRLVSRAYVDIVVKEISK